MELFEKINSLQMPAPDNFWRKSQLSCKQIDDYLTYTNNEEINWADLNNVKIFPLLDYINANAEYKVIMYSKYIPDEMIKSYSDFLDWDYLTMYSNFSDIERYTDRINWDLIWKYRKFSVTFIKKHIDKVNWEDISLNQILDSSFINEYKDKLDWNNLCIAQRFSTQYTVNNDGENTCELEKYIDYLTLMCWVNISKYQVLTTLFIDKYADKLDWNVMCAFQDVSDPHIIEKYESRLNWDNMSLYQKLSQETIETYRHKINCSYLFDNKRVTLTDDFLMGCLKNTPITVYDFSRILNKQDVSEAFIEAFLETKPSKKIWMTSADDEKPKTKIVKSISAIYDLSKEFLLKYKEDIIWYEVSANNLMKLPYGILFEKRYSISRKNWTILSGSLELPAEFIESADDVIDWTEVSMRQKLSESLIDKYKDRVCWEYISVYQKLSENFIRKHKKYIKWPQYILTHLDTISEKLIEDCLEFIDIEFTKQYLTLSDDLYIRLDAYYKKHPEKDANGNAKYVEDMVKHINKRNSEKTTTDTIEDISEESQPNKFKLFIHALSDAFLLLRK